MALLLGPGESFISVLEKVLLFLFLNFRITLSFLARHLFFTMTARSGHAVENQQGTISRVYYNKGKTTRMDWANSFTGSLRCFCGGMMNKDTKEPAKKVPLCRKSAAPTVASFGNKKRNEMEKNGDGEESRGGGQWSQRKGTGRVRIDMVMEV